MKWYSGKEEIRKEDWYHGEWASKLLFRARSGTLEVDGRNRNGQEQGCKLCGEEKETLEHLVIECEGYKEERRLLDREIEMVVGEREWSRRKESEDRGIRTVMGLTDDNHNNKEAVKYFKKFLTRVWKRREDGRKT